VRGSTASRRATVRPQARHRGRADDATRTHNTLSAESNHVQVFYSFHPLHGFSLRVVRRPKSGDGAVCVIDPMRRRLKIPVWMLSPDSAEIKIVERAHLSRDALLSLTSLLATRLDPEASVHDNLPHTGVDGCKGGHRAATTTHGPDDPTRGNPRVDRRLDATRTGRSHGPHAGGGLSRDRKE
jgi:hypothetical protein